NSEFISMLKETLVASELSVRLKLRTGKHTCFSCKRSYRHHQSLQRHKKYECGKKPSFKCNQEGCLFEAKLKSNLTQHLRVVFYASNFEEYSKLKVYRHDDVRYGCATCKKIYVQKKTLGRHLRFDCGQSPKFQCQVCSKKFKHGYILLKHIRRTHNINIEKLRRRHKEKS
ncbi:hypothetical protein NQ315_001079, partial [Exocentrus adspersus]